MTGPGPAAPRANGPFLAEDIAPGNHTARTVLVVVQVVVALAAVAVRFAAPGWLLVIVMMGGCVVVLLPLIVASVAGARLLRRGTRRLRTATAAVLAVMDLALLTFALTVPDYGDQADAYFVPAVALFGTHDAVSQRTADVYSTVAGFAGCCYLIAAAGVAGTAVVVAIARRGRA
ncbi:hypothetical protein [Amycolatopsis sp. WGS_07]|uniref:hypothetical protein n=1 Tax=Amycolatopsis sp. WGS_07 TaxID=3076764 RepID=UPI0038730D28